MQISVMAFSLLALRITEAVIMWQIVLAVIQVIGKWKGNWVGHYITGGIVVLWTFAATSGSLQAFQLGVQIVLFWIIALAWPER